MVLMKSGLTSWGWLTIVDNDLLTVWQSWYDNGCIIWVNNAWSWQISMNSRSWWRMMIQVDLSSCHLWCLALGLLVSASLSVLGRHGHVHHWWTAHHYIKCAIIYVPNQCSSRCGLLMIYRFPFYQWHKCTNCYKYLQIILGAFFQMKWCSMFV